MGKIYPLPLAVSRGMDTYQENPVHAMEASSRKASAENDVLGSQSENSSR